MHCIHGSRCGCPCTGIASVACQKKNEKKKSNIIFNNKEYKNVCSKSKKIKKMFQIYRYTLKKWTCFGVF